MSIYNACLDEDIRLIDTRHEQAAVHMAEGWSLTTRQMGVCAVTAGPGLTDAVTAVANAYQSDTPMRILGETGLCQRSGDPRFSHPVTTVAPQSGIL
jgi:acetolactate synthase-1/2/3 large subunit